MPREFTEIGSTDDPFFWSLLEFEKKLYAGTYGYPKGYNYPPWTHLKNFAAGEAVTNFEIFLTKLYCCAENLGYIYRMNTANPTDWTRVHDDAWLWPQDLQAYAGYLYCSFMTSGEARSKIIRSSNGDDWSGDVFNKANQSCNNMGLFLAYLYLVGHDTAGDHSGAWKTTNGTTWNEVGDLCGYYRYWAQAGIIAFRNYLFLCLCKNSETDTRVYRYSGSGAPTQVFQRGSYYSHSCCIFDGHLYYLFGPNMNSGSPGTVYYYLYRTPTGNPGTWELLKTFSATRTYTHGKYRTRGCLGPYANGLYVGIQNKIYRMTESRQAIFI